MLIPHRITFTIGLIDIPLTVQLSSIVLNNAQILYVNPVHLLCSITQNVNDRLDLIYLIGRLDLIHLVGRLDLIHLIDRLPLDVIHQLDRLDLSRHYLSTPTHERALERAAARTN